MSKLFVSRDVDVPPEDVWAALADFGNIHRFHPGLEGSRLTSDQATGVGTMRRCDIKGGGYLIERVTEWNDGERYSIEITETSFPLKTARASLAVEPRGAGRSRISMTSEFVPKYGLLGRVMDVLMMRPMMRKQMGGILDGLAAFARHEAAGPTEKAAVLSGA